MENLFSHGTSGEKTKQTDIGDIPTGWDVSALADVAVISSGGTPDRTKAEYWGGAIPWVKTGEIRYNTILATEERITQEGLDNSAAKVYPRGTLLMAMYGQGVTRGKVAILGIDASINQACAAITPSDGKLLPRFAFYYLQFTYERIRILGHGANQKNLNSHLVGSIQVPIPPTEEQVEIGTAFSAMDAKLDAIEREIEILEELFGVMLQQLVTGGVSVSNLVAGENG
jgi:type I restriction enzyme S subunit